MAARRGPPPDKFDWEGLINGLNTAPLEGGVNPPSSELTTIEDGRYTKMVFEINLFTTDSNDRCFMISSNQKMLDYGKMALSEAILKAKRHRGSS